MPGEGTPFTKGAPAPPSAVPLSVGSVYAVTLLYFASLMRFIDSSTLVTSAEFGSKVPSWPVLTKPEVSAGLDTTFGWAEGMIMAGGDMELPPDPELSEPIRLSRPPRAPYW